jgi:serine/threonine protein kinase
VDSKGITTIETGFSKVTLNKLTTEVTKIPQGTDQHEMFIQEIKNMIHLDSKGFDVGLIDYDHGVNPKIVTRYMGPSKLSDHYKTLSARGKKKMMEELLEQVAQIHKCGMVHRDLKPDNILVDARPRDGNHQFDAIIDYGIAMKINRKQIESYNTAATKFFGHPSQKESNFNASTGQDWFSLARIFALIIRGVDIDSLHAEIQISQTGLEMRNDISSLGFNDSVTKSISDLIIFATNPQCDDNATIGKLAKTGKALSKLF